MTETYRAEQTHPNLHDIPALRELHVRDDIVLRPLETHDAAQILGILEADPSIRGRVSVASKMHTPEDVAHQVNKYQQDGDRVRYAITEKGATIGLVSFWRDIDNPFDAPDDPDAYGFGYFLDPRERGNGIVSAAVNKIMETAEDCLYIKRFIAYCEDNNLGSIAILEKLGFRPTDTVLAEQNNGWVERKYVREVS